MLIFLLGPYSGVSRIAKKQPMGLKRSNITVLYDSRNNECVVIGYHSFTSTVPTVTYGKVQ